VQLTDGYVVIKGGEMYSSACRSIRPTPLTTSVPTRVRTKKLLLHKRRSAA